MPNPYIGNDEAARFVEYYASAQMLRDSVHRLYTVSIQRHMDILRRAEVTHKQHASPAAPVRSKQQIEEHVNKMVYEEMLRRQKNMTKLACDFYKRNSQRRISDAEVQSLVKRVYEQQMKVLEQRRKELQQRLGTPSDEQIAKTKGGKRMLMQRNTQRLLESGWRTPSAHWKYDDGRLLSVPQWDSKTQTKKKRHPDLDYLARLAKPLRPVERAHG